MAEKKDVVAFTEKDVKDYLDKCIRYWRGVKKKGGPKKEMAAYYIDAFQSVRISLFGECLAMPLDFSRVKLTTSKDKPGE